MAQKKIVPVSLVINGLPDRDWPIVAEWSDSQVRTYISKMRHIETCSACLGIGGMRLHNNLKVGFDECDNQELMIELFPAPTDVGCYDCYANSIFYENPDMATCLEKIKSGKCPDPFVIENIGKVFFKDKYIKQKGIEK